MADDFEIRAFQGRGESWVVTPDRDGLVGTELVTAEFWYGDSTPAVLTTTPTWVAPVAPATTTKQVNLALTGPQVLALLPGSYAILIGLTDGSAALAKGFLEVYPAPGGAVTPYRRCLATPATAQAFLPDLSREQLDTLPIALVAATRAIETFVGRPLLLDTYDHIMRPNNSIRFRLKSRPIVEVSRVASNVICGCQITNNVAGASRATVTTSVTAPNSLTIQYLTFETVIGSVQNFTTISFTQFGALGTFDDLTTAINALGNGWSATTQFGSRLLADAFGTPGMRGAIGESPWIHTHSEQLGWTWGDPDEGYIEVNEPIPGGFLIRNPRVERSDTRYWGIRFTYRAGYAVTSQDIALGYYPVPEDLALATVMTAVSILETAPMAGPVVSQSVKDRSYTLRDEMSIIPQSVMVILAKYQDFVI